MGTRGRELVATNESTVMAKPLLDPIMVENGQGDGGFANSASANKSDWNGFLSEINYLLDQLVAPEEGPWRQRRGFSRCARFKCEIIGLSVL